MKLLVFWVALILVFQVAAVSRHHKKHRGHVPRKVKAPIDLNEPMPEDAPMPVFLSIRERQNNVDDLIERAKQDLKDLLGESDEDLDLAGPPDSPDDGEETGDHEEDEEEESESLSDSERSNSDLDHQTSVLESLQTQVCALVDELKKEHKAKDKNPLAGLGSTVDEVKGYLSQYATLKRQVEAGMQGLMDTVDDHHEAVGSHSQVEPASTHSIGSEISEDQQRSEDEAPVTSKGVVIEVVADDNVRVETIQDDQTGDFKADAPSPYTVPCPPGASCEEHPDYVDPAHVHVVTEHHVVGDIPHDEHFVHSSLIHPGIPVVHMDDGVHIVGSGQVSHQMHGALVADPHEPHTPFHETVSLDASTVVGTDGVTTAAEIHGPDGYLSADAAVVEPGANDEDMQPVYTVNDGHHIHDPIVV